MNLSASKLMDVLVVGDGSCLDRTAPEGRVKLKTCENPYDGLLEMSRRSWPVVLLRSACPDFTGLCRSARRLQRKASLLAVCPPAGEPQARQLVGDVLDDYMIDPPLAGDWNRVIADASHRNATDVAAGALSPDDFVALVESARTVKSLESCVAAMVTECTGALCEWMDADAIPAGANPVLLTADDRPRALVLAGQTSLAGETLLEAMRRCLPALVISARRTESLHRLAITDHLTGAYNRRYFYNVTDRILQTVAATGRRATLLLYDIDDFKRYNESYGYATGDEILRETAALMKRICRSRDIVARIGGDEFAVLFWDYEQPRSANSAPPRTAYALADRFRRGVEKLSFRLLGPDAMAAMSVSGGLAGFPSDGTTCRELLRAADAALKSAKRQGKNAIALAGDKTSSSDEIK